jgi:transcriptional regulator with XRE-family HTH domain
VKEALWKEDREKCLNRSIPLSSLRAVRRRTGLSQRDLGRLAGVSPGTVYRLENGLRGAYPGTVRKLAAALDVSPAELVRGHLRE